MSRGGTVDIYAGRRFRDTDDAAPRPSRSLEASASSRSVAVNLPGFRSMSGYFRSINFKSAVTIPSGLSAWYGLNRIRVDADTAQDVLVASIQAELMSTDPDATGANTGAASPNDWGTAQGQGAAIVVGIDLPIELNEWTAAAYYGPDVEAGGNDLVSQRMLSPYMWTLGFPPGKWGASTLERIVVTRSFVPFVQRVTKGSSIDIALVVRGSQISGITGQICGLAKVDVCLGQTIHTRSLYV
jgi:hypothetical protein